MRARMLAVTTLVAALAAAGACSSDNNPLPILGVGGGTRNVDTVGLARVRLVNATGFVFDLVSGGVVAAGNAAIGFGEMSSCTPTNALLPDLSVRLASTISPLPGLAPTYQTGLLGLAPAYQSGVNYTVVAFLGSTVATLFATTPDLFLPVEGAAALRVFNASNLGTSYDVYVTIPGAPIDATPPAFADVRPGTFSDFGNADAGVARQVRITFAGSKNVLLDVRNTALIAGTSVTLVMVPPLSGLAIPRVFSAETCNQLR